MTVVIKQMIMDKRWWPKADTTPKRKMTLDIWMAKMAIIPMKWEKRLWPIMGNRRMKYDGSKRPKGRRRKVGDQEEDQTDKAVVGINVAEFLERAGGRYAHLIKDDCVDEQA